MGLVAEDLKVLEAELSQKFKTNTYEVGLVAEDLKVLEAELSQKFKIFGNQAHFIGIGFKLLFNFY